jgi:hypothetical protein
MTVYNDIIGYVFIKTTPGSTFEVWNVIKTLPGVAFASVITGPYDILVGYQVGTAGELGDFVVNSITSNEAIKDFIVETNTVVIVAYKAGPSLPIFQPDERDFGPG